jgi:hypothetical protein
LKLAILITSRNRPARVEQLVKKIAESISLPHDVFVAECGSETHSFSRHATVWFDDPGHRDDIRGFALALEAARQRGSYDYFWCLTDEVTFNGDCDVALGLIRELERRPLMAIAAPTWGSASFGSDSAPKSQKGWKSIASCEPRGYMIRSEAIDEVGFVNTDFRFGVGAMHELCYKLYLAGWFVARCGNVHVRLHAETIMATAGLSTAEYHKRSCRFAFDTFRKEYGDNWNEVFWNVMRGFGIEAHPFDQDYATWAKCFTPEEQAQRGIGAPRSEQPIEARMQADETQFHQRLNLGCGSDHRKGWINVDVDPDAGADLVADAQSLPTQSDASVDVIEARQLVQYLGYYEALAALGEWKRVLKPGGELFLELPDLDVCVRNLGRNLDANGFDPALTSLFGEPQPDCTPAHPRWAWTRKSLSAALREVGFDSVQFAEVEAGAGRGPLRDMRVRATCSQTELARSTPTPPRAQPTPAPLPVPAPAKPRGRAVDITGPLPTKAPVRIFAWPDYDHSSELEMMFDVYGRHLARREDVCLVLRQDKQLDGSQSFVRAKLDLAINRSFGPQAPFEILLLDDDLTVSDWTRLGNSLDCVLLLPSSRGKRKAALEALGVPLVSSADQLLPHIPEQDSAKRV